ncbi:FGGY-family carbohydrate kinase [Thalassobium sp. R2A62]|uniref:FGGY-family carbohydrate kinase n=1 Tax=Thalassobium sp. R2A62 TaxID=633131 RepID=UPI0001B1D117|nr:FGGY-family carbohydrate kinase [Thalassobium sp. R2A62]EET46842.1 fggy-family pentulose kinase [Thalassobium sp. R2A62]
MKAMVQGKEKYFVGVDVGTGSARAGVFDIEGNLIASAAHDIEVFRYPGDMVEQSSDNIWDCVCASVKSALKASGFAQTDIWGLGFDATCSLVVLDKDDQPLSVSQTGKNDQNVMVWMDHRAADQADRINATGHRVLDYVGGRISPEMETPKLLWLKEQIPETYNGAGRFFDLVDFLTWRATDDPSRSVCTVTCKWTYLAHENAWDANYFETIGLNELVDENFERIGTSIVDAGTPLGGGLTPKAASELGLLPWLPVGAGLLDAHAGGVGTIGAPESDDATVSRMAYVFGTSACTMSSTPEPSFVRGVWGPYYSAMVPGLWLIEGGQSAAGEALAQLVKFHPAYADAKAGAVQEGKHVLDYLVDKAALQISVPSEAINLAKDLVVVPEFLGNRAPFADPSAKAIISGLDMDHSEDALIGLYVAGIAGLGYGLRQILEAQTAKGVQPDLVVMSGGAAENPIVKQLLCDASGIPFAESGSPEPVLLGSAMLGAVAAESFLNLEDAMEKMSSLGEGFAPAGGVTKELHAQKFQIFEALQASARKTQGTKS